MYLLDDLLIKALLCYVCAFRYICEMAYQTSKSFNDQQVIEGKLNSLYMRKLRTISDITAILRRLKDDKDAYNYALILCTHVRNIHEACEVYESIVNNSTDPQFTKDKLGEYADYCLEWGRYEKANALLQRKLSLEKDNF